jgi:hypothetical protein
MLLRISTLKFWINLEPLDYFHLIGMARGGRSTVTLLIQATASSAKRNMTRLMVKQAWI